MKTYTQEQVLIMLERFNPDDFDKFVKFLNEKGFNDWVLYSDFIQEYIQSWKF